MTVRILGAGPAGAAAAIAALSASAGVEIYEKSRFPRHKVCGEFMSPDVLEIFHRMGLLEDLLRLGPARIGRYVLHFGRRTKRWRFPERALGLSRYGLDAFLLQRAKALGATVIPNSYPELPRYTGRILECQGRKRSTGAVVVATGRSVTAKGANRIFGFKAHFKGPTDDAVELFLFDGCYVGVCAVENGMTNVCGIAPENTLHKCAFEIDGFLGTHRPLAERLRPLSRSMRWVTVGPLEFSNTVRSACAEDMYPAGDALGFIDPFTGSGILNAVLTGSIAGKAAAERIDGKLYLRRCESALRKQFLVSGLFRKALGYEWVGELARLVPARALYTMTRPCKAMVLSAAGNCGY